jgi:hypothetical protein
VFSKVPVSGAASGLSGIIDNSTGLARNWFQVPKSYV